MKLSPPSLKLVIISIISMLVFAIASLVFGALDFKEVSIDIITYVFIPSTVSFLVLAIVYEYRRDKYDKETEEYLKRFYQEEEEKSKAHWETQANIEERELNP